MCVCLSVHLVYMFMFTMCVDSFNSLVHLWTVQSVDQCVLCAMCKLVPNQYFVRQ